MTLLKAVESLGLIEVTAVSWIYVIQVHTHHLAVFQIAISYLSSILACLTNFGPESQGYGVTKHGS